MMRRYNRWHLRFDQPDPYDGSYDLTSPQSLNRYAYVQGDPVNLTDPSGAFAQVGCYNPESGYKCPSPDPLPYDSRDWMRRWLNQYDYLSSLLEEPEKFPGKLVNAAKERINKGPCGDMFKGEDGAKKALEKLDQMFKDGKTTVGNVKLPDGKNLTDYPGRVAQVVDGKIYFNPKSTIWTAAEGAKLTPGYQYFPLGNLSREDALALNLIHELLHITGDKGADVDFDGSTTDSATLNLTVRTSCYPETIKGMMR